MMKKKFRDEDLNNTTDQSKTSDNKENTTRGNEGNGSTNDVTNSEDSKKEAPETGSGSSPTTDNTVNGVRAVEEKLAEMQDKYIRLSAEFDNYRKRTLREKMELTKYAGENIMLSIIPLMDDFERALKHMDSSTDSTAMKSGIDLIYGKFSDFLKQNGIKEIESLNNNFNVDIHEAVAKAPVDDEGKKGKVIDVIQKGYYLQDKVLRFSKVVVGE
jgi:molecular chaperone GrpE